MMMLLWYRPYLKVTVQAGVKAFAVARRKEIDMMLGGA